MIVHFLLLLLSGTLFQMMSGVPHHGHDLVSFEDIFVLFSLLTELSICSLYICAWFGLVIAVLMVFLKNALMCIFLKNVKLINHDCLHILMLYIMLAYLMLFAALSNAVCLYNAFFLSFSFCY